VDPESVIDHFRRVLRDIRAESKRHGPELGSPPTSLIVEQRVPSSHESFNTGATLRRWRVREDHVTEIPIGERPPDPARVGMYYDTGRATFSVDESATKVRIGWQVGPRYGRGYDLPIERTADGLSHLGSAKPLWVS
jgi:hypothetical protein